MDEDRRPSEDGGSDLQATDNVVHLPFDWIGSRDELVPIGRAAQSAGTPPNLDMPPAAEDFWGEGSAAVQDALQAPAGPDRELLRRPNDPPRARPTTGACAQAPPRRRLRPRGVQRPQRAALAVAAVASLALAGAIIGFGSSIAPTPTRYTAVRNAPGVDQTPTSRPSLAAGTKSIVRHDERITHSVTKRNNGRPRRVNARHPHATRHHQRRRTEPGAQPSQTFVSSTPPATPGQVSRQSSPASSDNPTGAGAASASQTPSASAAGASAGPSGRVALIGAGTSPSG